LIARFARPDFIGELEALGTNAQVVRVRAQDN
jgi:hypothetical protein